MPKHGKSDSLEDMTPKRSWLRRCKREDLCDALNQIT